MFMDLKWRKKIGLIFINQGTKDLILSSANRRQCIFQCVWKVVLTAKKSKFKRLYKSVNYFHLWHQYVTCHVSPVLPCLLTKGGVQLKTLLVLTIGVFVCVEGGVRPTINYYVVFQLGNFVIFYRWKNSLWYFLSVVLSFFFVDYSSSLYFLNTSFFSTF